MTPAEFVANDAASFWAWTAAVVVPLGGVAWLFPDDWYRGAPDGSPRYWHTAVTAALWLAAFVLALIAVGVGAIGAAR